MPRRSTDILDPLSTLLGMALIITAVILLVIGLTGPAPAYTWFSSYTFGAAAVVFAVASFAFRKKKRH